MIAKQDDIIARLVNENVEQENMINELMQGTFRLSKFTTLTGIARVT